MGIDSAPNRSSYNRAAVRVPLFAMAAIALLAGMWGGLGRGGAEIPPGSLAELQGPLLICGLYGTLISLERAVALNSNWAYSAPCSCALGTVALVSGASVAVGAGAYALAAGAYSAVSLAITLRQPALFTGTLLFGALAWLAGNLLWVMGSPIGDVIGWWLAFLLLTVAGERLELRRLREPKRGSEALFLFALGMVLIGAQNAITSTIGSTLFGMALLITTAWLLRHDIAWLNVRRPGPTRFMAVCMIAGYGWLAMAGIILLAFPPDTSTFGYDVALHAMLVGFVLSMVFGHTLIIFPAVIRVRVHYTRLLYAPLLLLHGAVALRVGSGLAEWESGRAVSGALSALVLMGFAIALAISPKRRSEPGSGAPVPAG